MDFTNQLKKMSEAGIHCELVGEILYMRKEDSRDSFNIGMVVSETQVSFTETTKKSEIHSIVLFKVLSRSLETINLQKVLIDQLDEVFDNIINIVTDIYIYCVGCYDTLEIRPTNFVHCGKPKCIVNYEEKLIGNPVTGLLRKQIDLFRFILDSGFSAINSKRRNDIFEPFPSHFLLSDVEMERGKLSVMEGKDYTTVKNFNKLQQISDKSIDKLISEATNALSDRELYTKTIDLSSSSSSSSSSSLLPSEEPHLWDLDTYYLIRFLIMSFEASLAPDSTFKDFTNHLSSGTKIFKVNSSYTEEQKFQRNKGDSKTCFLFHGSPRENWHSIIRNGLKNCSNTRLMTAGAAYGKGIYFADKSSFSHGYGSREGISYVGVYEIIGTKEEYVRNSPIHVVDYDDRTILRFLIIFDKKVQDEDFDILDNIFNIRIYETVKATISKITNSGQQKIIKEIMTIKKNKLEDKEGFILHVTPRECQKWSIIITNFPEDSIIAKRLEQVSFFDADYKDKKRELKFNEYDPDPTGERKSPLKYKGIEMEIKFPPTYPHLPPFFRVIGPRMKPVSGHITRGGAVCMKELTEQYWSSASDMLSIIINIKLAIVEGKGDLDVSNHAVPYTEQSARESYDNIVRAHGWNSASSTDD